MLRCEPLPGFVLTTAYSHPASAGLVQPLRDQRGLHAAAAILRQRCRAEERRNASFRNHASAAPADHFVFDARQEGHGSRQRGKSSEDTLGDHDVLLRSLWRSLSSTGRSSSSVTRSTTDAGGQRERLSG